MNALRNATIPIIHLFQKQFHIFGPITSKGVCQPSPSCTFCTFLRLVPRITFLTSHDASQVRRIRNSEKCVSKIQFPDIVLLEDDLTSAREKASEIPRKLKQCILLGRGCNKLLY